MKILAYIVVFLSVMTSVGFSQSGSDVSIKVSWQPLENNYNGKEEALSRIVFKNEGKTVLAKSGWKLYFNFIRIFEPNTPNPVLDIQHINGDLFVLTPNDSFKPLAPGEELELQIVSKSWIVNFNDSPQGFYIAWDNGKITQLGEVERLEPVDKKKFYRVANDVEMTPDLIFEKNKRYAASHSVQPGKIFPTPSKFMLGVDHFALTGSTTILGGGLFTNEIDYFMSELGELFSINFSIHKKLRSKDVIKFKLDETLQEEAYKLLVTKDSIVVTSSCGKGAFYAIQSIKSLIKPEDYKSGKKDVIHIPCVEVYDEPRFASRGFMIDVARNFQSKKQILKLIDILSFYKINTLHFHLNDDEGWRLELPSFPELTSVSSVRSHAYISSSSLPPSYGSGPTNKNSGTGYYSIQDFKEILLYANTRHVQVIPEIETPGHARAAVKAMQYRFERLKDKDRNEAEKYLLYSAGDTSKYSSVQKWNDNVMDVSLSSVYNFLEQVTDDIIGIYKSINVPLNTIHFGGDEVPNGVWEGSPAFEKLKNEDSNIKTVEDLWVRHFNKLYDILNARGLYLSGWEEVGMKRGVTETGRKKWFADKGLANKNIHLNVWNNLTGNEDLAYKLANLGYKVKLSFVSNFYMDMSYHKSFNEQGFYWGGFIDLERPFSFIPFNYLKNQQMDWLGRKLPINTLENHEKLTEQGKSNIVGIQALLWSETIKSEEQMEKMIFPRLLSFAERAWGPAPEWENLDEDSINSSYNRSLNEFFGIVGNQELKRLQYYKQGYKYRVPTPGVALIGDRLYANVDLPGFSIYFTEDGSIPTLKSKKYTGPIKPTKNMVFKVFNDIGDGSLPAYFMYPN
ncbi:family 20 glycosylhydrolase [Sphingobacterium bovisgrunnientis]|uniref:family 20 glycosylhydrolase n=1 Tax=Sphingobacterium bovisgrunnientis TaxID=1874697 RepID=UPI00135673B8|nr:family 20 glycosylhydrolase [Sphingobacterium bovisgrunnientis]